MDLKGGSKGYLFILRSLFTDYPSNFKDITLGFNAVKQEDFANVKQSTRSKLRLSLSLF